MFKLGCMCPVDFNMIEGGFNRSGIYPFNRNVITPAELQCFVADGICQANANNFRASCENEIYLTLTLKRTELCQLIPCLHYYFITSWLNFFLSSSNVSLDDFEHSCKHSETFKITNPIAKLQAERATWIIYWKIFSKSLKKHYTLSYLKVCCVKKDSTSKIKEKKEVPEIWSHKNWAINF